MFWKVAVFLGLFGIVVGIIILVASIMTLSSDSTDDKIKDLAVAGFIFGIILLIFSILLSIIGIIFVLRGSKREFEAKNT